MGTRDLGPHPSGPILFFQPNATLVKPGIAHSKKAPKNHSLFVLVLQVCCREGGGTSSLLRFALRPFGAFELPMHGRNGAPEKGEPEGGSRGSSPLVSQTSPEANPKGVDTAMQEHG